MSSPEPSPAWSWDSPPHKEVSGPSGHFVQGQAGGWESVPGFSPVLPGTNCVTYTRSFSSLNAVAHLLAQERGVPPTVGRQGSQWLGTPRCPLTGAGTLGRGHQGGSAECWAPRSPPSLLIWAARSSSVTRSLTQPAAIGPRLPGEMLLAHLFWVWIFKELGVLHDISEVLGERGGCSPGFFFFFFKPL